MGSDVGRDHELLQANINIKDKFHADFTALPNLHNPYDS